MDPSVASASVHRQPYLFWAARASGVDDVVGRVQDAVILEQLVHARVSELVVGAAADDSCAERGDHVVVDHAAERARRVDVDVAGGQLGPAGGYGHLGMTRPFSDWTNRPYARSSASDFITSGSPMMTALPPPWSRPAMAFL